MFFKVRNLEIYMNIISTTNLSSTSLLDGSCGFKLFKLKHCFGSIVAAELPTFYLPEVSVHLAQFGLLAVVRVRADC